jgi:2-methylcitrate dehydratase PrpD
VLDELLGHGPDRPAPWRALRSALAACAAAKAGPSAMGTLLGTPVACAALAVADERTAEELLLDAIACGVAVSAAIHRCITAARPDAPWDTVSVASRFGSVAAAGRLLALDRERIVQAFGIACGQAGGLRSAAGTDNQVVQVARAVFDGVEACLLAGRDFSASAHIVSGAGGVGEVLFQVSDYEPIMTGLRRWKDQPT